MKSLAYLLALLALGLPANPSHLTGMRTFLSWAGRAPVVTGHVDRRGVPLVAYPDGLHENPVTVAQWGLVEYSHAVAEGSPARFDTAEKAGRWLLSRQRPDGSWRYDFLYVGLDGQRLEPGWMSALAQAQAISLFVRLYQRDRDEMWIDAARKAEQPLRSPSLRSTLNSGVIFEEYPTSPPEHVLNGFMFVIIALRELAPYEPTAGRLAQEGTATLDVNIGLWDEHGSPAYNLTDRHVDLTYLPTIHDLLGQFPELSWWRARWS